MRLRPISQKDRAILKHLLTVTPLSVIGRGGTFLIYTVLANWFGVSAGMDFLYYHWGVAAFTVEVLSAASAYSVLVPTLAEERAAGHAAVNRCLQAIFPVYLVGLPVVCVGVAGISYLISLLFLPPPQLPTITIFGVIGGLAVFTMCASIRWLLKAVLDAYQRFNLPVILQGARVPVVIGIVYALKPSIGAYSIVLGLIGGEIFQAAVMWAVCAYALRIRGLLNVLRFGYKWRAYGRAKRFFRKCFLMMGAAIADGVNPVVDRGMAGTLASGSVSKLDYALKICAVPESLAGMLYPVLLSHWSELSAGDDLKPLRQSVWKGVIVIVLLMGGILAGFFFFAGTTIRLLYGHGVMSDTELGHIASLFRIYLVGMLPRLVSRLLVRAHLAIQNVRFIFSMTLIRTVVNPILNLIFMRFWGLNGIALATAIPSFPIAIYIGLNFWFASRR